MNAPTFPLFTAFALAIACGATSLQTARADEKPKPVIGDQPKPAEGEKPKPKPIKIGGKVDRVDTDAKTITLVLKGDGGPVERVVKLATDAKLFVDGKAADLKDVPKGAFAGFMGVTAKDGQPLEAAEVRITGSSSTALVKSVDSSSITLASEKSDRVIKVTTGTKVVLGGKDAKLADIKPGNKVTITMTADESSALTITAGATAKEGDKPCVKKPEGDKPGVKKPEGDKKPE